MYYTRNIDTYNENKLSTIDVLKSWIYPCFGYYLKDSRPGNKDVFLEESLPHEKSKEYSCPFVLKRKDAKYLD